MIDPNALILLDHAKLWWNVGHQRHLHDQSNKAHINATVENPKRSLDCLSAEALFFSNNFQNRHSWHVYRGSCKFPNDRTLQTLNFMAHHYPTGSRQKMCIWSSQGWLVTTSSKTTWWLYSKLSSCKSSWKRLFNNCRIMIPSPQTDHALWYRMDKNSNSWPTWNKSLNDHPVRHNIELQHPHGANHKSESHYSCQHGSPACSRCHHILSFIWYK